MIHPDYDENLNYPDLAILEIDVKVPRTLRSMLKAQQVAQHGLVILT